MNFQTLRQISSRLYNTYIKKYFSKLCLSTFSWLKKCEKLFDKNKLKGYGEIRIFDFLAERYFSFWISKYCKHKVWPYCLIDTEKK